MTTIGRKTGNISEGGPKHFAVASENETERRGKPASRSDWFVGWGSTWVKELRIERASLPPVRQLCCPDFGSVGPDACTEGLLDPV